MGKSWCCLSKYLDILLTTRNSITRGFERTTVKSVSISWKIEIKHSLLDSDMWRSRIVCTSSPQCDSTRPKITHGPSFSDNRTLNTSYVVVAHCLLLPFVSKPLYTADGKESRTLCIPAICYSLNLKMISLFLYQQFHQFFPDQEGTWEHVDILATVISLNSNFFVYLIWKRCVFCTIPENVPVYLWCKMFSHFEFLTIALQEESQIWTPDEW